MSVHLDWSGNHGAPRAEMAARPGACVHCRLPALLRHPVTGEPAHKVCCEKYLDEVAGAEGRAA